MAKKLKALGKSAVAFLGKAKDGTSVVGIGNLRVIIMQDNGSYFAQGLEIDYAAQGETIEDVKKHFEDGLAATIDEHLKIFGTIQKLLVVAPQEVWNEMLFAGAGKRYRYSQVTIHQFETPLKESFPFDGIEYRAAIESNLCPA
jgi:hypothetical protein